MVIGIYVSSYVYPNVNCFRWSRGLEMLRDGKDADLQEIESTPLETEGYVQADALKRGD